MSLQNALLTLLMGPTIPLPAALPLMERLQSVEVTHADSGKSGFQITFDAGRSGPLSMIDSICYLSPQLKPFSRVVIIVTFNAVPRVLMDGIITNIQYSPDASGGSSNYTVTGEDVSVMMDLEKKPLQHPGLPEALIAGKIILRYARYGLIPLVIPPPSVYIPLPIEHIPTQQGTDLQHLEKMARRSGYLFYIKPGPVPLTNTAYWGPAITPGLPQRALSVNLGHASNVVSINFSYNALSAIKISDEVQDRMLNKTIPVRTYAPQRLPLTSRPALTPVSQSRIQKSPCSSGLTATQAQSRAQGITDSSVSNAATATGELDVLRYGNILWPRSLVGLRGAGYSNDGFWYVKTVTHRIKMGEYTQSFSLSREGMGSLTPLVIP